VIRHWGASLKRIGYATNDVLSAAIKSLTRARAQFLLLQIGRLKEEENYSPDSVDREYDLDVGGKCP